MKRGAGKRSNGEGTEGGEALVQLWRRAGEIADARCAEFGLDVKGGVFLEVFGDGERRAASGAEISRFDIPMRSRRNFVRSIQGGGREALLYVEGRRDDDEIRKYHGCTKEEGAGGWRAGNILLSHLYIGSEWRVTLGAYLLRADGSDGVVVEVNRRNPVKRGKREIGPLFAEEWLLQDTPNGSAARVWVEKYAGEVTVTQETHYYNDLEWSPQPDLPAETAYYSNGQIFWKSWAAGGREVSRSGKPRFVSYWPDGTPLSTEFGNQEGQLERSPAEGAAYTEWYPDGSLALEIFADKGRIIRSTESGKEGVQVYRPAKQSPLPLSPRTTLDKTADQLTESQWVTGSGGVLRPHKVAQKYMHYGIATAQWRVKRFFVRHPEAAAHFKKEASKIDCRSWQFQRG